MTIALAFSCVLSPPALPVHICYCRLGFLFSSRKASDAIEQLRSRLNNEQYDAVIDFSAYNSNVVKDALEVLQDRIKLYLYISSDSVYEVSESCSLRISMSLGTNRFVNHRRTYFRMKPIVFDQIMPTITND
jgi:hypothetical protein